MLQINVYTYILIKFSNRFIIYFEIDEVLNILNNAPHILKDQISFQEGILTI